MTGCYSWRGEKREKTFMRVVVGCDLMNGGCVCVYPHGTVRSAGRFVRSAEPDPTVVCTPGDGTTF